METAPLTLAHEHLRNATHQQGKAAAAENVQAADDFAAAAQDVHNLEARRILRMLEQHHRDIARILESSPVVRKHASATSPPASDAPDPASHTVAKSATADQNDSTTSTSIPHSIPNRTATQSPTLSRLQTPGQLPFSRDGQTSIASNLATARGINRAQPRRDPNLSAASALGQQRGVPAQPTPAEAALLKQQRQHQHAAAKPATPGATPMSRSQVQDERFSAFYSTMEGFFSKLTAPLAFAGLPLNAEDTIGSDSRTESNAAAALGKTATTRPGTGVDKLFSSAALRALRNEQGAEIVPSSGHVQDSFMVVPTAGGTVSYAGILSRPENQLHGEDGSSGPTGDEFVDAYEMPQPSSPKKNRHTSPARSRKGSTVMSSSRTVGTTGKTAEELALENDTLRQLSDTLSKRLYMWETSAQERSEALQASIRTLRPPHTTAAESHVLVTRTPESEKSTTSSSTASKATEADAELQRVVKDLEAQLQAAQKDMDKVGRENDKLRLVVARYRERWEKLKEGARTRRETAAGVVVSPAATRRYIANT